jgi:hypothetical protein
LNENTVLSWAKREHWNLPQRSSNTGAGRPAILQSEMQSSPTDVLIAGLKENEEATRTSLSHAARRAAEATAVRAEVFPAWARNPQELQQLASATARIFGWSTDQRPSVNYYGDVNTVVVCDEKRRQQLIEQRQRLLEQEATQASGRETEAAAPVALPAPETQPGANVGAGNSTVAQDPSPATPQDAVSQHMESIRTAATWKPSDPEHHYGSFAPHPEELE